jgi:hypothetical protein|tara:strand:- start:188 stop:403 length:216 start_codon:yes stop_codon:yes gene_type:complete
MAKKKSKARKVLEHLIKYGSITTWTAFTKYRATRLSAIIFNLRHRDGYNIESVEQKGKDGYFVEYILHEAK